MPHLTSLRQRRLASLVGISSAAKRSAFGVIVVASRSGVRNKFNVIILRLR